MPQLSPLDEAVRHDRRLDRRLFLASAATIAALPAFATRTEARMRRANFADQPFTLGVASGDPTSTGVVLWTKLAPKPLQPDGGMTAEARTVSWEVATDEGMRNVVRRGHAPATPQLGHSVHVEVEGLPSDSWFWYRFRAGDAESPVGRTRTMPAADVRPEHLRFAFASCQHFETGYYTAYQHMVQDDLDLVVFLGDYIYERAGRDGQIRKHIGPDIMSLDDYRLRYAQYRSDPLLHRMHAHCPWAVTWDDHEVSNNYASDHSEQRSVDVADFLVRRTNAYQAYYEMMPLRATSVPRGPDMQLYRTLSFGQLAEFFVLDGRQYRSVQPHGGGRGSLNWAARDPRQTMLGRQQLGWLQAGLLQSQAGWNVLAQQVMMGIVDHTFGDGESYAMDQWPGYLHERQQIAAFMAERRVPNPIVITGDIHSNWVNDLRVDDRKPDTPIVATEFVGTSISSGGNGVRTRPKDDKLLKENPGVRFHNAQRGYVRCIVTPTTWRSDYQVVEEVTKPSAPLVTRASFVVESGKAGAKPA